MLQSHRLKSLHIGGYRPFRDFQATLGELEVIVGANGAGKSALFEFLRFLRDGLQGEIPPGIVPGYIGQRVFHSPAPEHFSWHAEIERGKQTTIAYEGKLMGPVGQVHLPYEEVHDSHLTSPRPPDPGVYLAVKEGAGLAREPGSDKVEAEIAPSKRAELALGKIANPRLETLYSLREYIRNWRFYSAFNLANDRMRRSVPVEQTPTLDEDAGNLSSVLHFLMTEYPAAFEMLQESLRAAVPGFGQLRVKARGGPGEVIAFWSEEGLASELTLADLSEGILRLVCWAVLCVLPTPPSLVCIDEPELGLHPRALPILAGLLEKACRRTQFLVATHGSYFLTQFPLSRIAVMRKEDGQAKFLKPADSAVLQAFLQDFGAEEIALMHQSDELERLA